MAQSKLQKKTMHVNETLRNRYLPFQNKLPQGNNYQHIIFCNIYTKSSDGWNNFQIAMIQLYWINSICFLLKIKNNSYKLWKLGFESSSSFIELTQEGFLFDFQVPCPVTNNSWWHLHSQDQITWSNCLTVWLLQIL